MPEPRMPVAPLVTAADLAQPPYRDRACELVDGRIIDVSPAHGRNGLLAGRIHRRLVLWAEPRGAGLVLSAETGFLLRRDPDTVRAPDVAFVRAGRPIPARAFVEGAPDVAVEVLSPDAMHGAVMAKVHDYLAAGAEQVWTVDDTRQTVTVHGRDGLARTLAKADALRGEGALAGLVLDLAELFAD